MSDLVLRFFRFFYDDPNVWLPAGLVAGAIAWAVNGDVLCLPAGVGGGIIMALGVRVIRRLDVDAKGGAA